MDDWCDRQDEVNHGDSIYRCSKCGKRLHPRRVFDDEGDPVGWVLPPHKEKGHKIRALKSKRRIKP